MLIGGQRPLSVKRSLRSPFVIHPTALAVHGKFHANILEGLREFQVGKLRPLIGVEDLRNSMAIQGLVQGRNAEDRIHGIGKLQGSTALLCQSMIATKYKTLRFMVTYMMSAYHT